MLPLRTGLVPLLAVVASLLTPSVGAHAAPAAAARIPVVFVHGYNADPGVWGGLREDKGCGPNTPRYGSGSATFTA
ncbi:hypothetical protein [Streptomyces sp. NPDC020681]|uniref:hypothetical protein n=1 Tax=Streptomyces sp. NPDC020681 TaxID=3365083 RepID=UPI0037A67676